MTGPALRGRGPAGALLAALPAAARTALGPALEAAGEAVVASARVGLAHPEGPLAASLGVMADPDRPRVTIASSDPRAAAIEFGTRLGGARPFLRPAVAAQRTAMTTRLREALARAVPGQGTIR